ncbi:MAG: hypothetical protein QNJ20_12160 [Paracoccaceae bacterium]|nr:hypothetical protein [Paracoccaceae bacterium]
MIVRFILILCLALAPGIAAADEKSVRDRVVRELRSDGYAEIRVYRTFLGRLRFVGENPDSRREIVVNPRTGVILRDYLRIRDDDEDDDREELEDEEDEDEEDNSGSGSHGDDDDEDDEDDDSDDDESDDNDDESDESDDSDDSDDSDESDDSDDEN